MMQKYFLLFLMMLCFSAYASNEDFCENSSFVAPKILPVSILKKRQKPDGVITKSTHEKKVVFVLLSIQEDEGLLSDFSTTTSEEEYPYADEDAFENE